MNRGRLYVKALLFFLVLIGSWPFLPDEGWLTTRHWSLATGQWVRYIGRWPFLIRTAYASVPWLINYQGRLTDTTGKAVAGALTMTFRLYDASTGGNKLWSEDQAITLAEADNGVFNCILGSVSSMTSVDFNSSMWLSVQVSGDTEMSPRQRLTAAGYAMNADQVDSLDSSKFVRTDIDTSTSGKLTITKAGTALVITPSSNPSANTKLLDVQNTSGTSLFNVDIEGDTSVGGNLAVTGTITGSTSITGTTNSSWNVGSASDATATDLSLLFGTTTGQESLTFQGASTDDFVFSDDVRLDAQSALRFVGSSGTNYVAFRAPSSIASSVTWTLPSADATSSGQALVSNSFGTLSWATVANSGGDAPIGSSFLVVSNDSTLTAERALAGGAGLTLSDGGANSSLTLNVGAGTGITVNADDVAIDTTVVPRLTAANTFTNTNTFSGTLNATGTFQIGSTTVNSTAAELNKLSGASANVTAANLGTLTGGGNADSLHTHSSFSGTTSMANLSVSGTSTLGGTNTFTATTASPILIKPSSSPVANTRLLDMQATGAGTTNFSVDAEGDVVATSLTTPLVIGGTGTTSPLTLRSTSGVGSAGADIIFQTGNNGATEAMRILNDGKVGIGTAAPTYPFQVTTGINAAEQVLIQNGSGGAFGVTFSGGYGSLAISGTDSQGWTFGATSNGASSDREFRITPGGTTLTGFNASALGAPIKIRGTPVSLEVPGSIFTPYGGIGRYENLALQSEALATSPWSATGASVTADVENGPNGSTSTADLITFGTTATNQVTQPFSSMASSTTYRLSVWAKTTQSFTEHFRFVLSSDGTAQTASQNQPVSSSGQWERFTATLTSGTVSGTPYVGLLNGGPGTGGNTVRFWGFQLEQTSGPPGPYVPTTTSSVSAGTGLVTNSIIYSGPQQPKRTIVLTAAGAIVPSSNAPQQLQTNGTNVSYYTLNYSGTAGAAESAHWQFIVPDSYTGTTVNATLYWLTTSTITTNVVKWFVDMNGFGDATTLDAAMNTAGTVTDNPSATANQVLITSEIANITTGWASGKYATVRVQRNAADAADTETALAKLLMVKLEWTASAESD